MIEPKSLSENLLYITARLVGLDAKNTPIKFGTGFFFNFPLTGDKLLPVLITNKHVIDGTAATGLIIHKRDATSDRPSGNEAVNIAGSLGNGWIPHPSSSVDLCALPVGGILNAIKPAPFFKALDPSLVPSREQLEQLDAVEDVLMIGYPTGLWDEVNNFPLIRRGITASHPAIPYPLKDYPGVPFTVLDIASFAGSSGSPVFIYNNGTYATKGGATVVGGRIVFLGVLFSGPQMQSDGQIIVKEVPTAQVPVPRLSMMINLGYIIASSEIEGLRQAVFKTLNL
jgi:hypothetical protein